MKISIVIPTRERCQYLGASIRTALAIKDDDIEVIVHDNISQDNTRAVVAGFDDPRLVYAVTDARVSMRENFNRAFQACTGDYVIFFGDDDGILPGQFPFLRQLLEEHRPDGLTWNRATYGWPDEGFGRKTGGIRFYRETCFGAPVAYNPHDRLEALMQCRLGQMHPTPNIYHGCVSRTYMDRIAPAPGLYFDSAIPDVNFEYRTILTGGKFLFANHVFSVNGYSPASTGGAHHDKSGDERSAKAGQAFVAENKTDPFEDVIDHALSVPLVFFSTLETLRMRLGSSQVPDMTAWYRYGFSAGRGDPELTARIDAILTEYAERTDTTEALTAARVAAPHRKRSFGERLTRLGTQYNSFRRSAEMDGENTVLSAAQVYDAVLGTDYGAVLEKSATPAKAWRNALKRSKAFQKQI